MTRDDYFVIEYLQDNSKIAKARDFLKGIKETVPGL